MLENGKRTKKLVASLLATIHNPNASKASKERALRQIRSVERMTGQDIYLGYNVSRNPSEMARVEEENG